MKILFLLTQLESGGAQNRVMQTADEMRLKGHEVDVAFLYEKRNVFVDQKKIILAKGKLKGMRAILSSIPNLIRLIKENKYDALVTNTAPANIVGNWIAYFCGLKNRIAVQTQPPQKVPVIYRTLDYITGYLHIYTINLANSYWTRQCFNGRSERYLRRMHVLPNGVTPPSTLKTKEEARLELNLGNDDFIYVNVGRLSIQKDQVTLIKAMKYVEGKLIIVGGGELELELKSLAEILGISSKIIFFGEVNRAQLALALIAADVFTFSSKWETFGLALVEATAFGLPLIVTNLDVSREVLGFDGMADERAIFVNISDVEGFALSMNNLRENLSVRQQLANRTKEVSQQFSMEKHASGLIKILMEGI